MEEDGYVWQWFNNDAQIYVNYNAEHSKKIEDAYLANQLDVNLDIGRGRYTISLDVFSQYNLDSGYKRLIQRVPSVPPLTNGTAIPSYGSNIEKPYVRFSLSFSSSFFSLLIFRDMQRSLPTLLKPNQ